jgi:signal transduction histidine kinase
MAVRSRGKGGKGGSRTKAAGRSRPGGKRPGRVVAPPRAAKAKVRGAVQAKPVGGRRAGIERPAGIGAMARMVAHEVRNALSVMYNVSTGLRRVVPHDLPDAEMLLGILDEELGRLDRLTHDLVSFAIPAPPVHAQVRLHDLLERAVKEARERCPAGARADVRVEIVPEAGTASLDPERMHEALVGLLRNGIEASNGRGKVEVRATRDGGMLRIEVTDEGPGIPPGDLERIFDPFYSTKPSGVGLALALGRQIARRHGGDLTARPAPGGPGACFRLEVRVGGPGSAGG